MSKEKSRYRSYDSNSRDSLSSINNTDSNSILNIVFVSFVC